MLHHIRVLIAEDNPIIALELALSVLDAEGEVVGPCASVSEALTAVAARVPEAAILDIQLEDGEVTPVAAALMDLDVPLVFHSAVPIPAPLTAAIPVCACAPSRRGQNSWCES